MIYVYLLPQTIWEKICYQLFKRIHYITCEEIRYGSGVVECTWTDPEMADKCRTVRMDHVLEIFWDGGYRKALADVKKEHEERMAGVLTPLVVTGSPPDEPEEEEVRTTMPDNRIYG